METEIKRDDTLEDTQENAMTKTQTSRPQIERLQMVLDVHGSDRDRWPAADRLQLARLLANDLEAQQLLAEAKAFDRLLDMAPSLPQERTAALARRIVAAAQSEGRPADDVKGPVDHKASTAAGVTKPLHRPMPSYGSSGWSNGRNRTAAGSAALLAASLFMGLVAGAMLLPGELLPGARVLGEANDEYLLQQLVMGEDGNDATDEDLL